MEAILPLQNRIREPEEGVTRQGVQRDDDTESRRRRQAEQPPTAIPLPGDRVTLSSVAADAAARPSEAVSLREKAALLGDQQVKRLSIRV